MDNTNKIYCGNCPTQQVDREQTAYLKDGVYRTQRELDEVLLNAGWTPGAIMSMPLVERAKMAGAEIVTILIKVPKAMAEFSGSPEEALSAGWVEGEFGWCCPDCVPESFQNSQSAVNEEDDRMVSEALKAINPSREPEA